MLRHIFRINAASCILFGLYFVLMPGETGQFIGTEATTIIMLVGAGLIVNGLHLLYSAQREIIPMSDVYYFSTGDFGWVLITITLIAMQLVITTTAGIVSALLVALFVGVLGMLQLWASHRADAPVMRVTA